METLRLQKLQAPSQTERLLERLVTQARLVPADAYQLRDPGGLPLVLQGSIGLATERGEVWVCWTDGTRIWFFTAEMSLPLSRERGTPVLTVTVYTERAELQDVGDWTLDGDGKWQRCAD